MCTALPLGMSCPEAEGERCVHIARRALQSTGHWGEVQATCWLCGGTKVNQRLAQVD